MRFLTIHPDAVSTAMRAWLEREQPAHDVVWIDAGAPLDRVPDDLPRDVPLLLTRGATTLPTLLGIEPIGPLVEDRPWRDDEDELHFHDFTETPRLRGHAAYRGHPLLDGLHGGAFTWWPTEGERRFSLTWRAPDWPRAGRIVAVERAHIHIQADRATIWEYDAPRLLCIGAYLPFDTGDPVFRATLERLVRNALEYATRPMSGMHWRMPALHPPLLDSRPPTPDSRLPEPEPLRLPKLQVPGGPPDAPFTTAGRRAFAAGTGADGVREIWAHPLRILSELRTGMPLNEWTVSPFMVERRFGSGSERIFVPADLPAAVIEWEGLPHIDASWTTDMRLMWPYDAGVQGALHAERTGRGIRITNEDGEHVAFECVGAEAEWTIDADENGRIRCSLRAMGERVRLLIAAQPLNGTPVDDVLDALHAASSLARARAADLSRHAQDRLSIDSPDPDAHAAIEWAKARLASYVVEAPPGRRSLIAGYWTSRPGWNEARPGYAWHFGRDAVWTAFASLAAGDFDASRDTLTFLARLQGADGKILHEHSTSGVVHYDAADSTPLFLLLAAQHLLWTGDVAFLRELWPAVQNALAFCLSTADEQGLIQNTRVGHGWIEFGRLGGGRVTYYNAGIWAAALRDLATAADSIGAPEALELKTRALKTRTALENAFWSQEEQAYKLRLAHDQTPDSRLQTPETIPTATHAVPLLLGVAQADRAKSWLDLVGTDDFTTPHGVRMCARSDPGYNPKSYHGGAVWPLYTGWVSWAEFIAGRPDEGFAHWLSNVRLMHRHAPGAWPEVLHGEEARSIGVTPDQAWSTAMVVSPLVYGMLGVEPDAPRHRIRLRPQPPREWDRFSVRNLRVGDAHIDVDYRRDGSRHIFRIDLASGAVPPRVVLEPALPGRLRSATIDDVEASLESRPFGTRTLVPVQFALEGERTVVLEMEGAWPMSGSSG